MVVDDDLAIREALQVVLEETGYEPVCVENGREALERLRDGSPTPCVILLDLMMPVMSGQEFLRVRHQDPELAQVPTVVVTAGGDLPTEVPVLKKPVSLDTILEVIERHCLAGGSSHRRNDEPPDAPPPGLLGDGRRCWGKPNARMRVTWSRRGLIRSARN